VNYIFRIFNFVIFKRINQQEECERSRERYRRIGLTAIASVIARVVNLSTGLITVPLTLSYLGIDKFGVWMTLSGLVAFLSFSDLGLGVGLQNALSRCDGHHNKEDTVFLVSTTMVLMLGIASLLCLLSYCVLPLLPLHLLVKVETQEASLVLLPTAQAFILIFAVGLPCGLSQKILIAYQDGFLANLLLAAGSLISLGGVLLCAWLKAQLPILVAVYMGGPLVALAGSSLYIYFSRPFLRPSFHSFRYRYLREIAGTGFLVMAAQIGAVIMVSGPTLLLANRFGTTDVVPFTVTQRMLGADSIILSVVLAPLWPAYGEASARGDMAWVTSTFRKSLGFAAAVSIPVFFVVALLGQFVIHLWTGNDNAVPSWSLLMACNVWALFMAWNMACAMLLNGLNQMKGQAIYGVIIPVFALMAGYFVAAQYNIERVIWTVVILGETLRGGCLGWEVFWTIKNKNSDSKKRE
jgi:O-antigen/teichoic acid export membrane protein